MPCYSPLIAFRSQTVKTSKGLPSISILSAGDPFPAGVPSSDRLQLPCGRCIGCRLERSRMWAVRCMHEASLHPFNCFITLTYSPDHLPDDASLSVKHLQLFMKRLRKYIYSNSNLSSSSLSLSPSFARVRFYACGEYGESLGRPHYHACLFGFTFPDLSIYSTRSSVSLYTSAILDKLWGLGFCTVGDVTFDSAAYVARYILKKQLGSDAVDFYSGRQPPFTTMSRRPGIGAGWISSHYNDVFSGDFIPVRGSVTCKPPRFYDNIYDKIDPASFEELKKKRLIIAKVASKSSDNSPRRLRVREKVKELQALKRSDL